MNETEIINPKSEKQWLTERAKDITSTEVSALFGISPYTTLFETWHRHHGNLAVKFDPTERTIWGSRLETSIAKGIAEDEGWKIRRMNEYIRDPKKKIGASFDFSIETITGLLEIKNVDALIFREGWIQTEDGLEAPPHIEMQVQHQLAVSGRPCAYIGALIGGNTIKLIKREPDPRVINAIYKKTEAFWNSIEDGKEPTPDFSKDYETIRALHSQVEAGKVLSLMNDETEFTPLMIEYQNLKASEKELEEKLKAVKAQIIMKSGNYEKIVGDRFSISMGIVKGGPVSYVREDYRNFKPYFKKEKK